MVGRRRVDGSLLALSGRGVRPHGKKVGGGASSLMSVGRSVAWKGGVSSHFFYLYFRYLHRGGGTRT